MASDIKIIDPYESYEMTPQTDAEGIKGNDFLNAVKSLQVGFGSKVLRIDRDGLWLGAADFATAPFKVDMDGNITATSLDLSTYLQVGDALADVQSDIFDLSDIDTDLGVIVAGTLIGVEVRGSLIRTSTSGGRVEIDDGTDNIEIYDTGGVKRMELDGDELQFFNSSGAELGYITTPSSSSFFIGATNGNFLVLEAEGSSYAITFKVAGSTKMTIANSQINIEEDVNINGVVTLDQDLEAENGLEDIGDSQAFDQCYVDDFYGIYNAPSDRRLKKNITDIESALTQILTLRPVSFKYKPKKYKKFTKKQRDLHPEKVIDKEITAEERNQKRAQKLHYGFIAQEVEQIFPALVNQTDRRRGENYKSLKYDEVIPLLVKAIQEQQVIIEELSAKVNK